MSVVSQNRRHKIFRCIRKAIQEYDEGLHQGPGELESVLDDRINRILDRDHQKQPDEDDDDD